MNETLEPAHPNQDLLEAVNQSAGQAADITERLGTRPNTTSTDVNKYLSAHRSQDPDSQSLHASTADTTATFYDSPYDNVTRREQTGEYRVREDSVTTSRPVTMRDTISRAGSPNQDPSNGYGHVFKGHARQVAETVAERAISDLQAKTDRAKKRIEG